MIFRDLAIHVGDAALLPAALTAIDFQRLTYHVQEGLLVHLRRELKHEHFLPDAGKLNVTFGPDVSPNDYSCCLGVAQIWIPEPDFDEFVRRDEAGQQEWILNHLADALRETARRQGASTEALERAITRTQTEGVYLRCGIEKLSRLHPGRKLKFNVVRCIQPGGESWVLEVCDRKGRLLETFPILEDTYFIHAAGALSKSRWRGDTFLLTDSRGRIHFQKSAKQLVRKYG